MLPVWRKKAEALVRMGENPFPYTSPMIYFKIMENHRDGKGLCCSAVSYSSREHPVQLGKGSKSGVFESLLVPLANSSHRMLLRKGTRVCARLLFQPHLAGKEGEHQLQFERG